MKNKNIFNIKKVYYIFMIIIMYPLTLATQLSTQLFETETVYETIAHSISLIPGPLGMHLRYGYYSQVLNSRDNFVVSFGSYFSKRSAKIGKNCNIGAYCIIGNVDLGDDVMIASRASLLSGKYQHGNANNYGQDTEKQNFEKISIGKDTWIGEGAIIASNIGNECIVAAGTVVLRDIPDGYLVSGNPGKPLKRKTS